MMHRSGAADTEGSRSCCSASSVGREMKLWIRPRYESEIRVADLLGEYLRFRKMAVV